jgi:hypothetical protein
MAIALAYVGLWGWLPWERDLLVCRNAKPDAALGTFARVTREI